MCIWGRTAALTDNTVSDRRAHTWEGGRQHWVGGGVGGGVGAERGGQGLRRARALQLHEEKIDSGCSSQPYRALRTTAASSMDAPNAALRATDEERTRVQGGSADLVRDHASRLRIRII
eukprot:scaffold4467_cov113-Isochrysis_galbana.AAC.3